ENDEVTLHDFVRDVGPKIVGGGGYLFLAEQDLKTGKAFLRMEQVPGTQRVLAVVDAGKAGAPGALYFFDDKSHALLLRRDGVSRPVTGIPMIATPSGR